VGVQRQEDLSSWKPVGERACTAYTANAVLPIPAILPIAWLLTTPARAAAAMSRGSVRVAAAAARPGGRVAAGGSPELDALLGAQRERIGEQLHRILLRDRKRPCLRKPSRGPWASGDPGRLRHRGLSM
jgi:hypothetical protein